MIQFYKMSQYKIIILLFFLFTAKSVMAADPFDNTIFTFDNDLPTTDQLDQPILNQNSATSSANGEVALDQPINTRYPITRYSLQGIIKSMNQTRMMFVSSEENTKFLLSVKDCLGLNCAYVTDIDKRGVITFEDEEGIYRFQVGYVPYIVEQKITNEIEEAVEDIITNNDSGEVIESASDEAVDELNVAEIKIEELEKENFSLLATVDFLTNSGEAYQNTIEDQEKHITQLEENIYQLQKELQNISSNNNDTSNIEEAEKNIINLEQKLKEKEDEINRLNTELQNISSNTDISTNADTSTKENNADLDNLQNIINSLNEDIDRKNNLLKESAQKISSQVSQIKILENKLNDSIDQNSDVLESENNTSDVAEVSSEEQSIDSVSEDDNAANSDSDVLESENNTSDVAEVSSEEQIIDSVSEAVEESNSDNIMIAKEDVNVREKPSPHTSIVGVLLQNTRISVLDNVQGWYKVRLDDGKIGYIYGPMLKEKD